MKKKSLISQRGSLIDASGIRKVFDLAANLSEPINFSIGQPHFDVREEIKLEAISAINSGFNRYTASGGIPELKEKIISREPELSAEGKNNLMITCGVSGGIMLAVLALVDPGDEVLIPDPGFVSYKHVVTMAGGTPVFFDTYPDFRLHPEQIESRITPKTKVLIINSPSNPTGVVLTPDEIKEAAQLCAKYDITIISDEIYRSFSYGTVPVSASKYHEQTVILRGFSKDYAMTGWRMGYASGPGEIIDAMTKLQQFSFVCAPSFAQKASIKALDLDISEDVKEYGRKRDIVYEGLCGRFSLVKPDGAFYCFPEVPYGTGTEFVEKAIEKNLLIVPGGVFSDRDTHFRISYAAGDDELQKGIDILNSLAENNQHV